jgi:uncharacterized membrane protein
MIWILVVILLIVLIVSLSKGNKKKNIEIKKMQEPEKKPSVNVADELTKLKNLKDEGIITPEEFEAQKKKLLSD